MGLALLLGAAAIFSVLTGWLAVRARAADERGGLTWPADKWSGALTLVGVLAGALLWPVSG